MAATLHKGQKAADYNVHEAFAVDTADHEDHTFCGIMFSIVFKDEIPLESMEVEALSVRGHLGPITVWVTRGHWDDQVPRGNGSSGVERKYCNRRHWQCVYQATHPPSPRRLTRLAFDSPLIVQEGDEISFYVHSELANDRAIVYDNQHALSGISHEDQFIKVKSGQAHLCNEPFASWHPWGSWRRRREFVGRIEYGCRFLLWNPEAHHKFPAPFKDVVLLLMLARPHNDCPLSWCSDDVIFYILNFLRHDWIASAPRQHLRAAAAQVFRDPAGTLGRRLSGAFLRGAEAGRAVMKMLSV